MKSALILIDIQNDYFKGGKSELNHPIKAAESAKTILNFFRENNLPVYHVQHINTNSKARFFLLGDTGTEINPLVIPKKMKRFL